MEENKTVEESFIRHKLVAQLLTKQSKHEGLIEFSTIFNKDFLTFINKEDAVANEAEMLLKMQWMEKELNIIASYPRLHTKNVVAIGGGFSAGKSEFISSFIQSDIKLPIGVVPTTAIPTYVFHEKQDVFLACTSNGGIVDLHKIDENFHSKLSHNFIKSFDFNLKDIMPYMMIGSQIEHEHICFIDTPGYNPATSDDTFTREDVTTAKEFLDNANTLVWLIGADANGTISKNDLDFLQTLDLKNKRLYIVYNKADLKPLDDIEDIVDEIEESLEDYDIDFEGISAYSSVLQEEYKYINISLHDFLESCDNFVSKHHEIHTKLDNVYNTYKNATQEKLNEKKKITKELHSLALDIFEEGIDLDKPLHQRITELKKSFSTKSEEESLEKIESVFEKFRESVDTIFGVKYIVKENDKSVESVKKEDEIISSSEVDKKLYSLKQYDKYGFVNKSGEWVIKPRFENVDEFIDDLARVKIDRKYGFVNKSGELVIKPKFDDTYDFENGLARVKIDGKYGFINRSGEWVIKPKFDYTYNFENALAKIEQNEKYGFIDEKGEMVIKPQFDRADEFIDDLARVKIDGKYGFINRSGEWVIKPQFDRADEFIDDLARVKIDRKYGFVNKSGELVIKPQFDDTYDFENGLAKVEQNEKYGFIDEKGKIVIKPQFDRVSNFTNGLARVKINGKYGCINKSGELVIKPQFDDTYDFENGLAKVEQNEKYGFIDEKGEMVIKPQFDRADEFIDDLARVKIDRKYGFINSSGEWVVEPKFDDADEFIDDLTRVKIDGKYGFINKSGEWVIEPRFDNAYHFTDDLARVYLHRKYGFINRSGEWVIEPKFDDANEFTDGYAEVGIDGKYGLINKDGKLIIRCKLDEKKYSDWFGFSISEVSPHPGTYKILDNGYVVITSIEGLGVKNKDGEWILHPIFDEIDVLDNLIKVKFGTQEGYTSLDGKYLTFTENDINI